MVVCLISETTYRNRFFLQLSFQLKAFERKEIGLTFSIAEDQGEVGIFIRAAATSAWIHPGYS
jgi:hypothetical protein